MRNGLRVVVFDNRDAGLSSEMTDAEPAAYRLEDMADDVVGLLDHLRVGRAHILGISMGGMIAQHVAIDHAAARAFADLGDVDDRQSRACRSRRPKCAHDWSKAPTTTEALIELNAENRAVFGSPGYPESLDERVARPRARTRAQLSSGRRCAADAGGDRRRQPRGAIATR